MKFITIIISLVTITFSLSAQTAGDALRYSYWQYGGSARNAGVAGSMGALGGDFSSIVSNPASLATFRRSEITFTPGVNITNSESSFLGETFSGSRVSGGVNEAGIIFATAKPGKWKTFNVGFGYTKLADFNQSYNYTGTSGGSIGDYFVEISQGLDPSQLSDYDNGLAYDTELIYETSTNGFYENDLLAGDQTRKFQNVKNKGSMGELNISFAGNYEHMVYIGGSIGLPFINFSQTKIYQEDDVNGTIPFYNSLEFSENLSTNGIGVNVNIGAIVRVHQAFRVGASFHSPTWITLSDSYSTGLDFDITYNEGEPNETRSINSASPEQPGFFEYNQSTPMRLKTHFGGIIKKAGFISAEVEWVDYRKNRYAFNSEFSNADDLAFQNELNNSIKDLYQSALNIKLGGEFVVAKDYRLRAGYALLGSPFENSEKTFDSSQLSLGIGYRKNNFFLDAAYQLNQRSENYRPYSSVLGNPIIENDFSNSAVSVTVGFKFGGKRTTKPVTK